MQDGLPLPVEELVELVVAEADQQVLLTEQIQPELTAQEAAEAAQRTALQAECLEQ